MEAYTQVVQQRSAQVELEEQRRQVQEIAQSKKQLQAEIKDLKDRLESETMAKNEETSMWGLPAMEMMRLTPSAQVLSGSFKLVCKRLRSLHRPLPQFYQV